MPYLWSLVLFLSCCLWLFCKIKVVWRCGSCVQYVHSCTVACSGVQFWFQFVRKSCVKCCKAFVKLCMFCLKFCGVCALMLCCTVSWCFIKLCKSVVQLCQVLWSCVQYLCSLYFYKGVYKSVKLYTVWYVCFCRVLFSVVESCAIIQSCVKLCRLFFL